LITFFEVTTLSSLYEFDEPWTMLASSSHGRVLATREPNHAWALLHPGAKHLVPYYMLTSPRELCQVRGSQSVSFTAPCLAPDVVLRNEPIWAWLRSWLVLSEFSILDSFSRFLSSNVLHGLTYQVFSHIRINLSYSLPTIYSTNLAGLGYSLST